jgi:hypothetical protein
VRLEPPSSVCTSQNRDGFIIAGSGSVNAATNNRADTWFTLRRDNPGHQSIGRTNGFVVFFATNWNTDVFGPEGSYQIPLSDSRIVKWEFYSCPLSHQ